MSIVIVSAVFRETVGRSDLQYEDPRCFQIRALVVQDF